ncbi:hypothetical protein [Phenylobacterium sp.]|uniref:hypothetical protein n=1 Tax=Phenylobacterium sp. TaxID=1871053 RepID=UPI002DF3A107|nr:hypothetical protein [Phenylobacterium sp.]
MKRIGAGIILGLCLGAAGAALAHQFGPAEGDHYQMGWTVLVRGAVICQDPYVRSSEREIECRSAGR